MQVLNEAFIDIKTLSKNLFVHNAFVALGSNLQDPAMQVKKALLALNNLPKSQLIKTSSLYLTAPVGYQSQPDFVNAVAQISTYLSPLDLLDALLNIEFLAGRERPFANAPRVLDCDLLIYEGVEMNTGKLTLPHLRMCERAFVLLPLAEIAPDLCLENQGNFVNIKDLIQSEAIQHQGIKKLA